MLNCCLDLENLYKIRFQITKILVMLPTVKVQLGVSSIVSDCGWKQCLYYVEIYYSDST